MEIPLWQIDAFAERLFEGNPAAVMSLTAWLDDDVLQHLAAENILSETAFYLCDLPESAPKAPEPVPTYHLRWFTPGMEVDLCGHATLATADHLFEDAHPEVSRLLLWTRSGWVPVTRTHTGRLLSDFPAEPLTEVAVDPVIVSALGISVREGYRATDLVYVADSAEAIRTKEPDFGVLGDLDSRGIVVTAEGDTDEIDFVSRWFGARAGIAEDPVTGSAHCALAPYWAHRLARNALTARQLSARGGTVECVVSADRVHPGGSYRRYLRGVVDFALD
ncbi:MAG: PhzF family phenazine biosynthesis protein [Terrimesophilobacter sp.]